MLKKILGISAFVLSLIVSTTPTQAQQDPPRGICKQGGHFNDFDFWVGEWEVFGADGVEHAGKNSIVKMEKDCLLHESWRGDNGSTGQSMNYYNPVTEKWRQVWVAYGISIDYEGGLVDGKMILEGTIYYYTRDEEFPFKGTWSQLEDGSVRQFFEQFDPEDNTWKPWFDGRYVRAEAE